MNKKQLERYRNQLRSLLDRVAKTAAGLEAQVRTPSGGEAGGGISNAPLHLGDLGSETYAQELGATLLENEAQIRDETHAALERIDRGTYGRCEHCGKPIVAERLDTLPYTRHCTSCAAQFQQHPVNLNDGRPNGWLGEPGHEGTNQAGSPIRVVGYNVGSAPNDTHAAGTPGGGAAAGGLAGTNSGRGSPRDAHLEAAMGSGRADAPDETSEEDQPDAFAGASGGAVGGTPANKRARGRTKASPPKTTKSQPKNKRK